MVTKVQKWGNSLALRIPKAVALNARLQHDSLVELTIVKKQITITPLSATHWSLDELLAGITKDNLHAEIDTGVAIGNEMW